jgi:hypothetical protein
MSPLTGTPGLIIRNHMNICTKVEDVTLSFPCHMLPMVQGVPDYHTIHALRRILQANTGSICTRLREALWATCALLYHIQAMM